MRAKCQKIIISESNIAVLAIRELYEIKKLAGGIKKRIQVIKIHKRVYYVLNNTHNIIIHHKIHRHQIHPGAI